MPKKQDWRPKRPHRKGGEGPPVWREFVDAYLEAALWSSFDELGDPLDDRFTVQDFAQEAVDKAVEDSNAFIEANRGDLDATGASDSQHGHDFWLTRNHHGVGFWDRGYAGDVGQRWTEEAHAFGEVNAYVGDDGLVYFMP